VFTDKRSKKIILLAHCVLNQNAKLDRCAHYPGAIREVAGILMDRGLGIIQMPCLELQYLGLARQAERGADSTVEAEDTRIARRMAEEAGRTLCREMAGRLVRQVAEYEANGFEVVGLIGINGSPTCGVDTTWSEGRELRGQGVFIQELADELEKRSLSIPMRGIKAYEPQAAVSVVTELLGGGKAVRLDQ
jgi:predicted secreted protein